MFADTVSGVVQSAQQGGAAHLSQHEVRRRCCWLLSEAAVQCARGLIQAVYSKVEVYIQPRYRIVFVLQVAKMDVVLKKAVRARQILQQVQAMTCSTCPCSCDWLQRLVRRSCCRIRNSTCAHFTSTADTAVLTCS